MAVPPQEAGQVNFSLPAIAVSPLKALFIIECTPQPYDQDVFVAALLS
jgi:hypothetical protein